MGLFDKLKSVFQSGKLDVAARFDMLREAAFGTMSRFHIVKEKKTGKTLGLKLIDPVQHAAFEEKFKGLNKPGEGEILGEIKDPKVIEVLEHGLTTTGQPYILMEYFDGPGLNSLILNKDQKLLGHGTRLLRLMGEALGAVHKAGFIHRDICPRNYLVSKDLSQVKLIDFGLAIPAGKEFNIPGNRTGTPNYMAPEILRRRATDLRVDIFALGVSAYQLLTYELPWPGEDASGKAALAHDTQPPDDILRHRPNLHPQLAAAVMKCLAIAPEDRPQTCEQFVRMLKLVDKDEK